VIGTEAVRRASHNGYTLLWAITSQIAIGPVMMKVPYNPATDLVPITAVSTNTFALVVHPSVPAKTLADFIAYVRGQPKGFS
jgi:tripartite-type tricarboxylate transporter receptor subunit TctC